MDTEASIITYFSPCLYRLFEGDTEEHFSIGELDPQEEGRLLDAEVNEEFRGYKFEMKSSRIIQTLQVQRIPYGP